jgi:hypothetical protein
VREACVVIHAAIQTNDGDSEILNYLRFHGDEKLNVVFSSIYVRHLFSKDLNHREISLALSVVFSI